jgi:beta-glucosidase
MAWYPGQSGGTAVGEALFGAYSPSGRLPVTFVTSSDQLPPFTDYSMEGRTYKFIREEPLYPFGFGLGYSSFHYEGLELSHRKIAAGQDLAVTVRVTNSGRMRADEIVQVYLTDVEASTRVPRWQLVNFRRVPLEPGATTEVSLPVEARQMSLVDDAGNRLIEPGRFTVHVGGSQPDARSIALRGMSPLRADFEVTGAALKLAP